MINIEKEIAILKDNGYMWSASGLVAMDALKELKVARTQADVDKRNLEITTTRIIELIPLSASNSASVQCSHCGGEVVVYVRRE